MHRSPHLASVAGNPLVGELECFRAFIFVPAHAVAAEAEAARRGVPRNRSGRGFLYDQAAADDGSDDDEPRARGQTRWVNANSRGRGYNPQAEDYLTDAVTANDSRLLKRLWELARDQNMTCFHDSETAAPVYSYEQSRRCYYCGCDALTTTPEGRCCQHGECVHTDLLVGELLELMTSAPGISRTSRSLNEQHRLCEMALQKGTHRCVQPACPRARDAAATAPRPTRRSNAAHASRAASPSGAAT